MDVYKNLGGDSNVEAYEISADSITVKFRNGRTQFYLYDNNRPGAEHVEHIKNLARAGQGLNSYIGRNLRSPTAYVKKW